MATKLAGDDTDSLSLRGFFLTGIRLAQNRLQILATELAEEKVRLTFTVIAGVAGLFFCGLAIVVGTVLLALAYWENRMLLLAVLGVLFALLGGGLLTVTFRSVAGPGSAFDETLGELKKDEDAWRAD